MPDNRAMSAHPPRKEPAFGLIGSRCMGFVLDLIVITMLCIVIVQVAITLEMPFPPKVLLVIPLLYLAFLPATPLQATLGKRMVGLRICDRRGQPIGVARSILRFVAFVPSIGLGFAGFVLAAFTPRRQALHDLVAGTFVVNRGALPAEIAHAPAPVSWGDRTVLVLGLGLLAWGAHTLWVSLDGRHRHDEAIELMTGTYPYRDEVEKALRSGGPMPAPARVPRQARTMSARPDGTIVIEVSDELAPAARVTLRPDARPDGKYRWTCRTEGLRYLPVECRS